MTRKPLDLAQALIRCPSVTPAEGGALSLLADVLGEAGFEVHRPVFREEGTPDVENLYARWGTGSPCLVFAGHTDVVPPGDASTWRHDPFSGAIEGGELFGRGAVDMKGGVACMVAAALAFTAANPEAPGSIAFLITGDEEGPAVNGTVKLLEWARARGERFDHCVLGEPTNPEALGDMIKIGRRGSLTGRLVVHGRQGHVAYPHLAENPIPGMVRLLAALGAEPLDAGTEHFDASNLEVTTVDAGNPATNVVPAEVRATFNIRFNDTWTPETLEAEIRRRLDAAAGNTVRYTLRVEPTNAVAFLTAPGPFVERFAMAVEAETGRRPALSTTGGTSDARFIKDHCPVLEFGLVGQTMHAVDERVAVADLDRLAAIYRRFLDGYFGAAA
ncbi:succinyl-diaminopimelate desuccinylase [Salinarimonas soli]|uniref:Succinyl-diaminopimelate desuccinylase n=1 Tax=Salinarimonas soli TaxID=1638099 RepID=A0A5B2VZ91_9HYPH|nr:succinyl-diaminopimelate desuccinylase [Salinarimonas soli]KAA2244355.1 succinyl-diaminopimelate desuccinylase [Salinarimonas soli]